MVPNQSPGRKRSPGRNAKVRQCIDIPLAMELRGASQYATKVVRVCTVLDNMTSRAQNQELFREIELITLLDGYDLPEEQELVPLSVHQWDSPLSHSEWENKYKDIPYRIYIRIGEYIGLDLDTLCKRHRISGKRHYALNLPQPSAPNWKSALGITAYVEAELTKQQIQRIAVDKRVRLTKAWSPDYYISTRKQLERPEGASPAVFCSFHCSDTAGTKLMKPAEISQDATWMVILSPMVYRFFPAGSHSDAIVS